MKALKRDVYVVIVLGCAVLGLSGCQTPQKKPAPVAETTVRPQETDELLANPGMGWETFHHTRDEDRNLPNWIPSTVHYARWGWDTLEPQPGKIDYAFLDEVLRETRQAGQRLAFRVMCCSTRPGNPYVPAWLAGVGGRIILCDYGNTKDLPIPDLDDPVVLQRHLDFIRRLGARYDGDPDIDHVDLGSVGWWGEWHMSSSKIGKMPTMENRKKIIDAYLAAFQKTPLLMLIGDPNCLAYATSRGTGWRADCLGDMGGFSKTWCHMCNAYPRLVTQAGVGDVWKTAPVAWETCWDMRRWVKEGWSLRYIFNYALDLHGSYLNNKSTPLPEGPSVRPEIERFLRRLGYRLVLRELRHPERAKPGQTLELTMKWQNIGSAPCYRPYRVAYRFWQIRDTNGAEQGQDALATANGYDKTLVGNVTVEKWMPGEVKTFTEEFMKNPPDLPPGPVVNVTDRIVLPQDMPVGTFRLAIGVVGERTPKPVVRLGIKGRTDDGWYPLSEIKVSD
jgi:Domain of unknown function (DUF4832)